MKAQQMRDMTVEELDREIGQLKKTLFNLRLQKAIGQLEKPSTLRETKRDIARASTILRERTGESAGEAKR